MEQFVKPGSIVRKIWGKSDSILFIFAGSAAEFALNKAVDWLYFTGRLPADPLGRLFSTVSYARRIVFSGKEEAESAIRKISSIHQAVEKSRGDVIPDWAYRDVLFMLIDYSIRSYELLHRKLTYEEKFEVFDVFYRVGKGMELAGLPKNYDEFVVMRKEHLQNDLVSSDLTKDLFRQYHKHLGTVRYHILRRAQALVVPTLVNKLAGIGRPGWISPMVPVYKLALFLKLEGAVKSVLLPSAYKKQFRELDINS